MTCLKFFYCLIDDILKDFAITVALFCMSMCLTYSSAFSCACTAISDTLTQRLFFPHAHPHRHAEAYFLTVPYSKK
ncbi:hypothetical protein BpHYR1_001307 [Brachionus plicatilis]|uniref:Uncharacterized protein n=1 Tax=Brachionus plicatilis TaxID=10195 RepID=A0A3M7T7A7_BRAPC|nr:hypothetical protein BpHYR1_001307 [Brachionus plicatilis]